MEYILICKLNMPSFGIFSFFFSWCCWLLRWYSGRNWMARGSWILIIPFFPRFRLVACSGICNSLLQKEYSCKKHRKLGTLTRGLLNIIKEVRASFCFFCLQYIHSRGGRANNRKFHFNLSGRSEIKLTLFILWSCPQQWFNQHGPKATAHFRCSPFNNNLWAQLPL